MDQQNTAKPNSLQNYLQKFLRNTIMILVVVLILISVIRAGIVVADIHLATRGRTYKPVLVLAMDWSPAYRVLHKALKQVRPDIPTIRQGTGKFLLFAPNYLVNLCLTHTLSLWLPAGVTLTMTPPPQPEPAPAIAPASRQPEKLVQAPEPLPLPPAHTVIPKDAIAIAPAPASATPSLQPAPEAPPSNANALWAAVIAPEAPIYSQNGERLDAVPAGSVVQITGQRSTTNGTLFTGTVHSPIGRFDHILLRQKDLQIYHGKSLTDTSLEERERASDRARLLGAIAARKAQLEAAHENRNPYQQRYHDALRRYQALRQEADPLKETYETSSGAARMNAGNRLRELRQEMLALTPTIRELQQQRDEWSQTHAQTQSADPERDPQIIHLRRQLEAIEPVGN